MPATRPKFSCGHRGFGSNKVGDTVCHRCQQADKLAKSANEKDRAEAQRLYGPQKKKGSPKFTPNVTG